LCFYVSKGRISCESFEVIVHKETLFEVLGDDEDAFRDVLRDELFELDKLSFPIEIGREKILVVAFFVKV